MILVITDTYQSFLDFCRERGLNPHSRPRVVMFVNSYEQFFGVDKAELVLYANWRENPVHQNPEIWEFLIQYGQTHDWKMPEEL
jgi:hypothetical protein